MERRDNYATQAQQAKKRFLTYDQSALVEKSRLKQDEDYIYVNLLCQLYRICRKTGDFSRQSHNRWLPANSHPEVMTLLDLLCDSRSDRWISGQWKSMASFGGHIHRDLLESGADELARHFDTHPDSFHAACAALWGSRISGGDMGYAIPLFEKLCIGVIFWHGDEEFPPQMRFLWDENALMYLRYETMYYAVGLLRARLKDYLFQ